MPLIPAKRSKRKGDPAAELAWQIEQGLGFTVATEVIFHPTRKWRFDVVVQQHKDATWIEAEPKLAIEIEGGLFMPGSGRHNRGTGMRADLEKYNEAVLLGWKVLRVLPEWVASGVAFRLVERAVKRTP